MKTKFGHLQVNVVPSNFSFYHSLFEALGWTKIEENEHMLAFGDENQASVWFMAGQKRDAQNDYDGPGVNHIGIHAAAQSDVDDIVALLKEKDVETLFETPRHRSEFSGEGTTYYQVMFASPDNLLFEVVYIGPKS